MLPAIVLPFHDPDGLLLTHLDRVKPQLQELFSQAFLSISPATEMHQATRILPLSHDPFFHLNFNKPDSLPGEHYLTAYQRAVASCQASQVLHLCDIDKVAFLLQSSYRAHFTEDIIEATKSSEPLLFQRSPVAWQSYPQNYREIEYLVIKAGQLLFNRYYDFAWSHLVIQAGQLGALLPHIHSRDFGVLIEVILLLRNRLQTKDVDWLVWEDPFVLAHEPEVLAKERERSKEETHKRLRGILPFFQHLLAVVEPLSTETGWERT